MTLPNLQITIADPGRGAVSVNPGPPVIFGQNIGGSDPEGLVQFSDLDDIRSRAGFGVYAEDLAKALAEAGGPIYGVGLSAAGVAGSNGAVTRAGVGPICTYSGTARETFTGKLVITKTGDRGVARFKYTLDAHDEDVFEPTYSPDYLVPSGGTFAMGDSGLTWTFPATPYTSAVTESDPQSADTLTVSGTPANNYDFVVEITKAGDRSGAEFKWSSDGGDNYTTGVAMGATNVLGATGITLNWSAGAGGGGDDYTLGTVFTFITAVDYVEGDTYTFEAKPAFLNATNIAAAADYVQDSQTEPSLWVVAGTCQTAEQGSANAEALGTALATFATDNRFAGGIVDVGSGDAAADVVTEAADWSNKRVCPAYGYHFVQSALPYEGFSVRKVGAYSSIAARASRLLISTDLARFAEGSLGGVVGIAFDGKSDSSIDDAKIACLRTWSGAPGFFIGKARIKTTPGSDFTDLHFRRIMDRACSTLRDVMLQFSSEGFRTVAGGTLDPRDAADVESAGNEALANALIRQDNARGTGGHVSAVSVTVDLNHNIVSTGQLKVKLRIRPLGYAEEIIMNAAFTTA